MVSSRIVENENSSKLEALENVYSDVESRAVGIENSEGVLIENRGRNDGSVGVATSEEASGSAAERPYNSSGDVKQTSLMLRGAEVASESGSGEGGVRQGYSASASALTPKAPANPSSMVSTTSVSLSQNVIRLLSDKSYEKRKLGATDIEKSVQDKIHDDGGDEFVVLLINTLTMDYTCSINSNQRKGGLIGLAAVALGLGSQNAEKFLHLLFPAILKCFDDPEVRVRYYACEALYNVVKIGRKHVLGFFNFLFDNLCKLFADVDADVRNGAHFLDRLIKEIVSENSESFELDSFLSLLEKYLKMSNPYIRKFLLGWILALDSVPEIDMVSKLNYSLCGVFDMLSDGNREIRRQGDITLSRFLTEIEDRMIIPSGAPQLNDTWLTGVVDVLVLQCHSWNKHSRRTAISWIDKLIDLFEHRLSSCYAGVLETIFDCLGDLEADTMACANRANEKLLNLVRGLDKEFPLPPVITVVISKIDMIDEEEAPGIDPTTKPLSTRLAALRWVSMLLDKYPAVMEDQIERLTPAMLSALNDPSEDIAILVLDVLARIARNANLLNHVVRQIICFFKDNRALFDSRGSFVIRRLCLLLEQDKVYLMLAKVIQSEENDEFAHLMIQVLNLILITAPELRLLRESLKRSWISCTEAQNSDEQIESAPEPLFVRIFKAWSLDPIAALSLCLLSSSYELSSKVVQRLADVHVTVGLLMEVDKLVQLLESPAFVSVRLELVNTENVLSSALFKTLYGLLMLLPQSMAYTTLLKRLKAASSMRLAIASCNSESKFSSKVFGTIVSDNAVQETSTKTAESAGELDSLKTNPILDTKLYRHFCSIQDKIALKAEEFINSQSVYAKK